MYIASGLPDSAGGAYRKAVELDPRTDPLDEIGILVAYHRGDLAGATAAAERVVNQRNIDPSKRRALMIVSHQSPPCLAGLYIEAGRYRKMREVTEEFRGPASFRSVLANQIHTRLLVEMGQWQEIIDIHTQHERMAKEDTTIESLYPRDLGKAYAELGNVEKAREIAGELRRAEPAGAGRVIHDANEIDARATLADNDPKAALRFLAEMRKNGVPFGGYIDIDYRTTLARAYRMAGQLDKAAEVHRQMLKIYGSHALSHYELGRIYEEMKRPAEAKKEYAKFLEMWSEADEDRPQLIDARKRLAAL
jgi:tetratricopeptide (TPR) repeat protein